MSLRTRRHAYHRRLADWPSLTTEGFEALVQDSLELLPDWADPYVARVAIMAESEPPDGDDAETLGLYVGATLFGETDITNFGAAPDVVLIFQGPHERQARSRSELRAEVAQTLLHEIAHHFGLEEETLDAIGSLRAGSQGDHSEE